jgi:hypothetical protein
MTHSRPRRRHLSADQESTCGLVSFEVLGCAAASALAPPNNSMQRTALRAAADVER